MIQRFRKVSEGLYRGSAPTPKDVEWLKENLGIRKIVSLDSNAAHKITRTAQLLGIEHVILPIQMHRPIKSLLHLFQFNFQSLFLDGGPVFVHCLAGKDRTGLVIGLLETKYFGKDPANAIEEQKSLGFGLGEDPKVIGMFERLIMGCKPEKFKPQHKDQDKNNADIVSNEREYIGDNRDSFLDEGHQGSFAPYLSVTKQNPMDSVYNFVMEQSPTRENYQSYKSIKEHDPKEEDVVPMVGVYNNDAGGRGFGPAENNGGFIYD
jgi:hypothetical protein